MKKIVFLNQKDMPKYFYNILPDLPKPLDPPLDPATKKPVSPDKLSKLFPMELIKQEVSTKSEIKIPEEVLKLYSSFRPSPLIRATRLEEFLDTPAKIYYKYEGVSPTGSHKTNTAIVQAYYGSKEGLKRFTTETGAGQWGSALSFACSMFGLDCTVYMVKVSYEQKPYRKILMKTYGADVIPSPSDTTKAGRKILEKDPDTTGSLGMAISEAISDVLENKDTKYSPSSSKYSLGSVLNFVLMHQTIIGLEAKKQMDMIGEYPDVIIGCAGGGSNFAGISLPFIRDKLNGKKEVKAIAVESKACPSMTKGRYEYDLGDSAGLTPLLKMYTLGADFVPDPIHAGGLRYHGMAPIISLLLHEGIMEAKAYPQTATFKAAITFANTEGLVVAPETSHAIKAVIDEAQKCKEEKKEKTILFNLSGHGFFDLQGYQDFLEGKLG